MTDGSLPDLLRGRVGPPPRRRSRQWIGLTVVAIGMAAATVAVPPLIAPRGGKTDTAAPPAGPASPPQSVSPSPPAASPSAPPRFAPISIQAEDPGNRLSGGASAVACATCRGGHRVRYLCATCALLVRTTLPVAGQRTVTVYYEVDGPRSIKISINGGPARGWPVTGPDWTTPQAFHFTVELPAGELQLRFYNDDSPAPDLDEVVVS
ncbi:hypothetical protein [Dactylosporangium sp. CA-092794]|uniref:hypothetical protein n=1 Tax=Dactylosporangium sp. CA-092794 TaxID=3239929 RepID=UPI003D8B8923